MLINESKKALIDIYNSFISSTDKSYESLADYLKDMQSKWNQNLELILNNQSTYEKELLEVQQGILENLAKERKVFFEKRSRTEN